MTSGCRRMEKMEIKRRENKPWRPIVRLHVNECHLFFFFPFSFSLLNEMRFAVLSCLLLTRDTEQPQAVGYCGSSGWAVFEHNWDDSELISNLALGIKVPIEGAPVALHYITLAVFFFFFFCFQKGKLVLWCFNTPKGWVKTKMKEKKQNFISQADWTEGLSCFADPRLQHFLG